MKDTIMVAMPKLVGEGFCTRIVHVKYEWKPTSCAYFKVFGNVQDECPNNIGSDVAKNLTNPRQAPKGVLVGPNGTNRGTSNLASKEANSSGSSFWNVGASNTTNTPIVDRIDKFKKLIIDGKVTLVDDEGKPLKKVDYPDDHDNESEVAPVDNEMASFMALEWVGFGTNSLLEQWKDTYENADYDYDHMMMICMMARKFLTRFNLYAIS
nr:hypothetical protein [Tanacetum cinerariifolium]